MRPYLLMITAMLGISSARAQTSEPGGSIDTTLIGSTIAPICTVETLSPAATVSLNTVAAQQITDVRYTCNGAGGFSRTISSENGGALRRGDQSISYLLSSGGNDAIAFAPVSLSSAYVTSVPSFLELMNGAMGMLSVAVPNRPAGLLAGNYTDTVTIEIIPN